MNSKVFLVGCLLLLAACSGPIVEEKDESQFNVSAYCTVQLEPNVVDLAGLQALDADDETEVLSYNEIEPGKFEVTVCTFDFSETNAQQGDTNTEA
jgi:hypothetical protein